MFALKPLLFCLLAGSSSAFAPQPKNVVSRTAISMSGGADVPPPDLKVRIDFWHWVDRGLCIFFNDGF
jgi:hypothetical protein